MGRWRELMLWRLANVLLLGCGWMLSMSGLFVNISMTSTAVSRFVGPKLSTVPVGLHMISSALSLCIAYFAIPSFGRRVVYIVAGMLGAVGSALMIVGSRLEIFGLLLAGSILQGPSFGVAQSFRFTAAAFFPAPQFSQEWRTRSISITVGCAVFAAGIGPEATRVVRDDLGKDFTGGYTLLMGLYLAQALLTGLVDFKWLEQIQGQQQQQQQQQHQKHLNEAPQDVQHCKAQRLLEMVVAGEEEQLQQQQQQQQQWKVGQQPGVGHALDLLNQQQQQEQRQHHTHHQQRRPYLQQQHGLSNTHFSSEGGATAHAHQYQSPGVTAHVHQHEANRPPWPLDTGQSDHQQQHGQGSTHFRGGVTAHVHQHEASHPPWPLDTAQSDHQQQHAQASTHFSGSITAHVHHFQDGHQPWPLDTSHLQLAGVPAQRDSSQRDLSQRDSSQRDSSQRDSSQRDLSQRDLPQRHSSQRYLSQRDSSQRGTSQRASHTRLPVNCQAVPGPAAAAQQDACSGSPLVAPNNRVQVALCKAVPATAGSDLGRPSMGPQSSSMHGQQGVARIANHDQIDAAPGPSLVQAMAKVDFVVPALSGATAFFTMAAVMSSTPVGMQASGHSSDLATFTIEAHVGAMYLPALVVGDLVKLVRLVISSTMNSKFMVVRLLACMVFLVLPQQQQHHHHHQQYHPQHEPWHKQLQHTGQPQHEKQRQQQQQQQQHVLVNQLQTPEEEDAAANVGQPEGSNTVPHAATITFIMVLGSAVLASSPGVLLAGTTLQHFMGGLVLLGVGWALNYITASSLVTAAFSDPEQLRTAQSIMDLSVLTLMAAGNATAGVIVRLWGWRPFLILYLAIILALFVCNLMYHAHVVLYYRRKVPIARECQTVEEVVSRK